MAMPPQNSPMADTPNQPHKQIGQITRWFEIAIPNPSDRHAHTQIGVHLEEVSELLQALHQASATDSTRERLGFAADVMTYTQRQIKAGALTIDFDNVDRTALLDALCDQIVTAVGVAHTLGMDIEGALKAVAASNDSRFGAGGQPIFNDQRKILKGPRYRSPDLAAYTVRSTHEDD